MAPRIDLDSKDIQHGLPTPEPESPARPRRPYRFSTLCATVENPSAKDQYGSSSVPIYQTSTFKGVGGEYDYSRSGNPTRSHLEHHIAKISSAAHAHTVSSGMAALDVILRLLKPGEEIVAGDDVYGGTNRLLTYLKTHAGIVVHHVDTTRPEALYQYVKAGKTAMVLLESPTNPLLKIVDLAQISADVKARAPDALIVVDNTMMSPYLQRPLEHGADIVYDSATKYLSGHHDLMAGVITCNRDDISKQVGFVINSVGNALTPFDSFLLLRGIKTLAIRMDRQQSTAMQVANMLDRLGFQVHYPGLRAHANRAVHERIADGPGAVLSFTTGNKQISEKIVGATRLWGISVSFGAVNSLISMPCVMSHASIDSAVRAARGLPEDLIRLCVGIEDPVDLLDDLEHALLEAGAIKLAGQTYTRISVTETLNKAVEKLAVSDTLEPEEEREWFVCAPGKIILFGEHAVVHGVTAIAASVDLRCYGLTSPRGDGKISVHFLDIEGFYHEWTIDNLPWDVVTPVLPGDRPGDALDAKLMEAITLRALPATIGSKVKAAATAFLYLYMILSPSMTNRPSFNFTARSTLPVGAGLGSSASFSVCAATALLILHRRISIPNQPPRTRRATISSPAHVHISHQGRRAIPPAVAEEVNRWAFIAEKVLHGNPSGVDNSVAVFGGALAYTRSGFLIGPGAKKDQNMEPIHGFKSLKFLLTNSKVPRDTKQLVANVGTLKAKEPEYVENILQHVQVISDEARRALSDPELSREALTGALTSLIDENHVHLVNLGVSHESLEEIRDITAANGLRTKLTGAGGGGCAVTLIPDDYESEKLQAVIDSLAGSSFDPYLTSVGGSGLGILSPHQKKDERAPESYRQMFASMNIGTLTPWAESQGRWLYV